MYVCVCILARDAYLSRLALSSSVNASKKQPTQHNSQGSNANNNPNTNTNIHASQGKSATKMSAIKAMKEVARMTRNINGSINRILSSDDLHTKKWLEKRLLSISQVRFSIFLVL